MALKHLLYPKQYEALKEKCKFYEVDGSTNIQADKKEGFKTVVVKEETKPFEVEEGEEFSSLAFKQVSNLLILSETKREQESNKGELISSLNSTVSKAKEKGEQNGTVLDVDGLISLDCPPFKAK